MATVEGLNIIIVGAGISGLSSSIALRRAGHEVKIYERSNLENEIGAAIHVCPNASRILLSWGFDPLRAKLVIAKSTFIANGKTLERTYEDNYQGTTETYGAPWYFSHRVDLHAELKRLAVSNDGIGKPVDIIAGSKAVDYNPELGTVTLDSGVQHVADLVVAADGVHSIATQSVLGYKNPATHTGHSAFRLLIPTSELDQDPVTNHFLDDDDGRFKVFIGDRGNRLIWYPCRNNEEHNLAAIFMDGEKEALEDWDVSSPLQSLLAVFGNLHPDLLHVCKKATSIKKWPLLFRPPIKPWFRSKLVLVGDAAHPMLPFQGQAGAQAIEDAAALGIMFSGITKHRILQDTGLLSRRLELFQQVRLRRGSYMQIASNAGQDQSEGIAEEVASYVDGKVPANPQEFMVYNFSHDVVKESIKLLQEAKET